MAIGDKPNSNLFGTNFNDDDKDKDKEKEAQLAAQNALMGAGNIPASAFGQAPAVAPFSMEAAGQVNPMMQAQSLEATPQALAPTESASSLITNNPFLSTDETPVAAEPPVKNALLEMLERADAREAQGLPRQDSPGIIDAPSGVADLASTPSVTPPVERPTAGAQEQPGAFVSPFLQSPNTPSGLGGPLLRGFEMVNEEARGPNAPMGQDATRAALGGMTLNEYLNAPAGTEGVSGLRTDPQGRMIPGSNTVGGPTTRAEAFPDYEREVERAQARLSERDIRPGERQQDRDTRIQRDQSVVSGQTGGLLSQADLRDLAQASMGDATEGQLSRGLQIQQRAGLGQFKPDSTGGLKPSDILARERFEFDKQQALTGDDTSDNATDRKIDTIKQANPNISDADAAAIASGSVRVVTNDLTGVTQLLNIATGESRQIQSQPAPAVDFDVALPEKTLFSRAGDFTGAVEATKRKAQGITGQVGLDVATKESLEAAQDFETAQNELVRAFRESSRYAASEAAALKKELNISLSPFEDPKSAEAKLRSIDKSLARRYENEVATFRDTTFGSDDRQDARMRAKAIAEFRANLGVPPEVQGSTSSNQGKVPQDVDPKEWEFMSTEERNLFN